MYRIFYMKLYYANTGTNFTRYKYSHCNHYNVMLYIFHNHFYRHLFSEQITVGDGAPLRTV